MFVLLHKIVTNDVKTIIVIIVVITVLVIMDATRLITMRSKPDYVEFVLL